MFQVVISLVKSELKKRLNSVIDEYWGKATKEEFKEYLFGRLGIHK